MQKYHAQIKTMLGTMKRYEDVYLASDAEAIIAEKDRLIDQFRQAVARYENLVRNRDQQIATLAATVERLESEKNLAEDYSRNMRGDLEDCKAKSHHQAEEIKRYREALEKIVKTKPDHGEDFSTGFPCACAACKAVRIATNALKEPDDEKS